jgi:hypothetical protein
VKPILSFSCHFPLTAACLAYQSLIPARVSQNLFMTGLPENLKLVKVKPILSSVIFRELPACLDYQSLIPAWVS